MVDVAPFRAHEFAPERVPLDRVVSPPHDVMTEAEVKHYKAASTHNIVHLTLPGMAGRTKAVWRKALEKASHSLDEWMASGHLRPTSHDVVYAYECHYTLKGTPKRLRGTVLRLRIDPAYRTVVPHEEIFEKFSENRLSVLRATGADLEPIELLYSGKSAETPLWAYVDGSKVPPDLVATGSDGALHKFWRITDEAIIETLADQFKGRKVYIADGHHRYHAAVRYAQERRKLQYRPPKDAPWEFKMALMVHANDAGLGILPTHRVVKRAPVKDERKLLESWASHFQVRPVELPGTNPVTTLARLVAESTDAPTVGAWLGEAGRGHLLVASQSAVPEAVLPGRSLAYRSLDVVHLQQVALARTFRIAEEDWADDVAYTREDDEALDWVRKKKAVAVLTHRPTRLNQLMALADAGEKMPQKSTYFVPKILSGPSVYVIGRADVNATPKRRVTS